MTPLRIGPHMSCVKIFSTCCLTGIALCAGACAIFGVNKDDEIIYRWSDSNLITVYNLRKKWLSSEGITYLKRRNQHYGEFGGQFKDCSNDEFFCQGGGINVAIPKTISGQKEWHFNDRYCRSETGLSRTGPNIISCRNMQYITVFTYEVERGVTSYLGGRDNEREEILLGDRGLFAAEGIAATSGSREP